MKATVTVLFMLVGLAGCRGELRPDAPDTSSVRETISPEATVAVATAMPVDPHAGLPQRVTPKRSQRPYPLLKQGASFAEVQPWQRLELNPDQPGRLLAVRDSMLIPDDLEVQVATESAPPVPFCGTAAVAMSMDAGPRQNWLVRRVKSLSGQLWQRWFGDEEAAAGPATVTTDPLLHQYRQQVQIDGGRIVLSLAARQTEQGVTVSSELSAQEQMPVLHQMYLERRNCQRAWPDSYQLHGYWQQTPVQAAPGAVRQRVPGSAEGGFVMAAAGLSGRGSGSAGEQTRISLYQSQLQAQSPEPVWQLLGFGAPEGGARAVSGSFGQLRKADALTGAVLVLHIARPVDTRYITQALVFRVRVQTDGRIELVQI